MRPGRALAGLAVVLPAVAGGCGGDRPPSVKVVAADYAYRDVPASIRSGTRLTLVNRSAEEVHELVAVRVPDGETRPAAELVKDPAALSALFGAGPPAALLIAGPGTEEPGAVGGDGRLRTPGRYLLVCNIPTGADARSYLSGRPSPGGPPHLAQGMFAELKVV